VRTDAAPGLDAERIAAFYAQAPGAALANILMAILVVIVMWVRVPNVTLFSWLALVVLANALCMYRWHMRRRDAQRDARWRYWAHRSAIALLASGLAWGGGCVAMFEPDQPLLAAFWLILITGICAGVVAADAFYLPALWAHVFPLLVPIIVRMVFEGGTEFLAIAFGLLVFLVFCVAQGRHQARLILDTLRMRHESRFLIEALQAEKQVADAARQVAEESSAAKSRFFAAASHDLRQPMQAISLFASNLSHASLPPDERQYVERINESATTLGDLFDELLDISRIDAKAIAPRPRLIPLQGILDRLELIHAPVAIDSGTRLYVAPSRATIFADELLLGRIVGNFISNGLKYARGGTVAVVARRRGERIAIEVRDNGPGIPRAEQQRIFEEFFQLDNPARDRQRGFGLGLATARRIAGLIGAEIGLRSHTGRGSVFFVLLPREPSFDPQSPSG